MANAPIDDGVRSVRHLDPDVKQESGAELRHTDADVPSLVLEIHDRLSPEEVD